MRRLFGAKTTIEESSVSKPVKANMGKRLDMYFNEELSCWVKPGEEDRVRENMKEGSLPPPAPTGVGGPMSPLPSNAKQVRPPWLKSASSEHRRVQSSFQAPHPTTLHQLVPAHADDALEESHQGPPSAKMSPPVEPTPPSPNLLARPPAPIPSTRGRQAPSPPALGPSSPIANVQPLPDSLPPAVSSPLASPASVFPSSTTAPTSTTVLAHMTTKSSSIENRRRWAASPRGTYLNATSIQHSEAGPILVVRRASRTRMQHRSPPISRRGTLDTTDPKELTNRQQPVITFDRIAFRSKYSNTIQALDELFASVLEVYLAEQRKIGKEESNPLFEHFDRLIALIPGTRTTQVVQKFKQVLINTANDLENNKSALAQIQVNPGGELTLVSKQIELLVMELEELCTRQKAALAELNDVQEKVLEDEDVNFEDDRRMLIDRAKSTFEDVVNIMTDIRNEVEEITCLSDSLLGQRRVAEEEYKLNMLQIGRKIENHFESVIKPEMQELMIDKIVALQAEHAAEIKALQSKMEKEMASAEQAFELEKIEYMNDMEKLKRDLDAQQAQFEEQMAYIISQREVLDRERVDPEVAKQEWQAKKVLLDEEMVQLESLKSVVKKEREELARERQTVAKLQEELAASQQEITSERMTLKTEREFLEREKKRIILVAKGLDARKNKSETKPKTKKTSASSGPFEGVTETC